MSFFKILGLSIFCKYPGSLEVYLNLIQTFILPLSLFNKATFLCPLLVDFAFVCSLL